MRILDIPYSIYYTLPNFGRFGLPGKAVNRVMAIILKVIFDATVPRYLKRTAAEAEFGLNSSQRDEKYIVSFTSFPGRIDQVWIVAELLLRQSFKPDAVILWLSEEQFPDRQVPKNLVDLKDRGLTIEFCKDDLRAHKKYYYALKNFPDANIVTVDDDTYYDSKFLERLVKTHLEFPSCIIANRCHRMVLSGTGKIMPYRKWNHNYVIMVPDSLLFPTGIGGVLYPKGCLPEEAFNINLIKNLCFQADDIWLKIMTLRNGMDVVTNKHYNKDPINVLSTQQEKLVSQNVQGGGNDEQLHKVLDHFHMDIKELVSQQ